MKEQNKQIEVIEQRPFKDLIKDVRTKERFEEMLGKNATSFLMSVLNCVQSNEKLAKCEPQSILMASAVAGTLGLPIDPNLGQAYIIPYNVKVKEAGKPDRFVMKAQFQMGYKGLIQLGHRSQQFAGLNSSEVRQGEYKGVDRMTGEHFFEWIQDNDEREALPIVGFVAFFKLVNGFEKSYYMTRKQMSAHGMKYSKTFTFATGRWAVDFVGMGKKTVLKLLIDKFAPKSVELQKAIRADQAIVGDYDANRLNYVDNDSDKVIDLDEENAKEEKRRVLKHIQDSKTVEILEQCEGSIPDEETQDLYNEKKKLLTKIKK
ncbi:MAG: recombinase RecT [Candidatus Heimdallarchaeota archaeon]|nr:recombinase RecT [Candidatus Heimdallarchaeota archaeon]